MAAAHAGRSVYLAERLAAAGTLTAREVADAAVVGDPVAVTLIREAGARIGGVLAGLVSFFNPGLVVITGGIPRFGHPLLAEIRSVVYRPSLPPATGNLPLVPFELGEPRCLVRAC